MHMELKRKGATSSSCMRPKAGAFLFLSLSLLLLLTSTMTAAAAAASKPNNTCVDILPSVSTANSHPCFQGRQEEEEEEKGKSAGRRRRELSGLGSSPPRCNSKCGKCTPCKPVHVPVPPGTPVTAEYYPEAWRCKCGNELFMP